MSWASDKARELYLDQLSEATIARAVREAIEECARRARGVAEEWNAHPRAGDGALASEARILALLTDPVPAEPQPPANLPCPHGRPDWHICPHCTGNT